MEFNGFMDLPPLVDGEISLVCTAKNNAILEKNWVPAYVFDICVNREIVGLINLRIGHNEIIRYAGHIGYFVNEEHWGKGYAPRAVKLLVPVLAFHKMDKVLITNSLANIASQRVCEKIGAKLIATETTPKWHDTYAEGWRTTNIYEWEVVK